jgi:protein Tob/BTG
MATMQKEIDSAVQFICGLLRARSLSLNLLEMFRTVLCEVMYGRYEGHWFPDKPCKGSAYRCVRINDRNLDPLLVKAGQKTGLTVAQLLDMLPSQLTIWVDPLEVAYRIGEDGSIGVLYDANAQPLSNNDDVDSSSTSGSESVKSSPSQSPVPTSSSDESSPPSPRHYGSCRQQQDGVGTVPVTGGQYLSSVLIASS